MNNTYYLEKLKLTRINLVNLSAIVVFVLSLSNLHSQCTFGNENPGYTDPANFGANYILGTSFNCPVTMEITALNLFGLGTNSQVQMALYQDNSGVPGALLATSSVGVVGNGIVSLPITPLIIPSGNYWIMAIYPNDGTSSNHSYYTTNTSQVVYYDDLTFGNPMPTDASGFMSYSGQDFHYWASGNAYGVDVITECTSSYTWIDGNNYTSNNNTATYTIAGGSTGGCDSIVSLDLTFINPSTGTDEVTECSSYTWIDGNTYTSDNTSATYTIAGGASNGCDSIVTLNLTINNVTDVSTSIDDFTITAANSNASYVWLDCDDGYQPIPNEINQSFTATFNGNYAVQLTENGCVDTSECVVINTINSVSIAFKNSLNAYPNPTNNDFYIDLGSEYKNVKVSLLDISGRILETNTYLDKQLVSLSLDRHSTGSYFIKLNADGHQATIKMIKD